MAESRSPRKTFAAATVALAALALAVFLLARQTPSRAHASEPNGTGTERHGTSTFCHVTDGRFTDCDPGTPGLEEWSDVPPTTFDSTGGAVYVDQADLVVNDLVDEWEAGLVGDQSFFNLGAGGSSTPDGLVDHLMLLYESDRTVPLGPDEYVLVHFMTTDDAPDGTRVLLHYAVRIYGDGTFRVFIDGVERGSRSERIETMIGKVGFGPSPTNPVPHVFSEFQIGLEVAGFTVCCYSPDPAWWSSSTPPPRPPEFPSFSVAAASSTPYLPSDILALNVTGGPAVVAIPAASLGLGPVDDLDALSYGKPSANPPINFSVRPGAVGAPGSDLAIEAPCAPNEVAGDEYSVFTTGTNEQRFDENGVACAGNAGLPFGLSIGHDVDALDNLPPSAVDTNADGVPEFDIYFSLTAGSPALASASATPADVLVRFGGTSTVIAVYAPAAALGLTAGDDLDALELAENGLAGYQPFNPVSATSGDRIVFSLRAGSPTLGAIPGATAGALLVPNPSGGLPLVSVPASNLGLAAGDDLNALKADITFVSPAPPPPPPPPCGDGIDNDGDGLTDEEPLDGIDNDSNNGIDEDTF
ncbi:MAG: hypothetical protein HY678_12425, partial [Chloroflexi bacterium]|nr:hypothetical protein [Chloroflexota bacterium]